MYHKDVPSHPKADINNPLCYRPLQTVDTSHHLECIFSRQTSCTTFLSRRVDQARSTTPRRLGAFLLFFCRLKASSQTWELMTRA